MGLKYVSILGSIRKLQPKHFQLAGNTRRIWSSQSITTMDGYAPAFVAHNLPFIIVSGLGNSHEESTENSGIRITSELPPVESEDGRVLLRHFKEGDAGDLAWNGREHVGRNKFKIKAVGRV